MPLKEYAPIALEDEKESEEFSPSRYSVIRKGKSSTLRRSIYFLVTQLLVVVVTAVVSVSLVQKYRATSSAGDNLESHSPCPISVSSCKLAKPQSQLKDA